MPQAAVPLAAEALLVEAAVPTLLGAGTATALGTGLAAGGGLGLLGASGGLGLTAAGTGLGLGGIAGLSSVPIAAATAATPLAMGQISAALAPTAYGLGGAATGLGTGLTAGGGLGLTTSGGLGLGSGLGTGAELYGLGTGAGAGTGNLLSQSYIDGLVNGIPAAGPGVQVASYGSQTLPQLQSAADAAKAAEIANNPILNAITKPAIPTGLNPAAGIQGTLTPGTSHLVGGGVEIPGEGSGIGNLLSQGMDYIKENPKTAAGAAIAYKLFKDSQTSTPEREKYSGPLSRYAYDPDKYTPYTPQPPANPYKAQYTSYARGGIADLGGYSDGGRMLKGPGDGMSDSIPASIAGKQPARLANEEFVVPADVVSHLGNGSSDAGAKQLYRMMDRIRKARTGTKKQGRQINPSKYMPA